MERANEFKPFPLFKGACRLPTMLGIPRTVFIFIGTAGGSLFLIFKVYALPVIAIVYFICWMITRYDDRAFRILGLWFATKFKNTRNRSFYQHWKASSYSPTRYHNEVKR